MEWTWRQQLYMLLQSGGVGFLLGIVYDLFVTVGRVRRFTRPAVFACDAFFGMIAALITFFFSLAIMDGQLHPLLFIGIVCGFGAQHVSVSRLLCRITYRVGVLTNKGLEHLRGLFNSLYMRIFAVLKRVFKSRRGKITAKREKKIKKFRFFQKNS